jgi:hypothetical protein
MRTKKTILIILPVFFLFSFLSVCIAADGDLCAGQGITVRNLSLDDLWYMREGSSCVMLKRNYSFDLQPETRPGVFSDMLCTAPFCPPYRYEDYQSYDADGNCRVKILPGCVLSDM